MKMIDFGSVLLILSTNTHAHTYTFHTYFLSLSSLLHFTSLHFTSLEKWHSSSSPCRRKHSFFFFAMHIHIRDYKVQIPDPRYIHTYKAPFFLLSSETVVAHDHDHDHDG